MKTALYTGFDAAYSALAAITTHRMADYAVRHGMNFIAYPEPTVGMDIYWTGMARGLELFNQGYDAVMYLDVDQLITNLDVTWPAMTSGIHLSKDWGEDAVEPWHFSACGFLAYRDAMPFFERVLELQAEFDGEPFPEQAPMRFVVKEILQGVPLVEKQPDGFWNGCFNIHPRRTFNAVPDAVCPGKVPEPWQPGDFAAHLTMAPMEQRIELARNIIDGKLQRTV